MEVHYGATVMGMGHLRLMVRDTWESLGQRSTRSLGDLSMSLQSTEFTQNHGAFLPGDGAVR